MNLTKKTVMVLLFLSLVAALIWYFIGRNHEIPLAFIGDWKVNKELSCAFNESSPGWKKEYADKITKRKEVLGYRIKSKGLSFTIDGVGSMEPFLDVERLGDNEVMVAVFDHLLNKKVKLSLILENNNQLRIKSDQIQFYMVFSK